MSKHLHLQKKKKKKTDKKIVEGSPVIIQPNKKESDQIATADVFSLIKELHQKIDALQADVNHVKEKQALTQHFFQTSAAAVPASSNVFTTPTPSVMPPYPFLDSKFSGAMSGLRGIDDVDLETKMKAMLYLSMLKNL